MEIIQDNINANNINKNVHSNTNSITSAVNMNSICNVTCDNVTCTNDNITCVNDNKTCVNDNITCVNDNKSYVNDNVTFINSTTITTSTNDDTTGIDEINTNNGSLLRENSKSSLNNKKILVLSGGGIKGLALVGCLRALESLNIVQNIQVYAGASVGSLIIALYNIGYSANELYKFIKNFNFDSVKDINILNIFTTFGIDNGQKIERMIEKLITNKKYDKNTTLQELYNKTKKEIIFSSVCLNNTQVEYISYKTFPELTLVKAIRMSISIPWYYCPVQHNNKWYVDGGCIDNYPVHLFKDQLDDLIGVYLVDSYTDIHNIDNLETYSVQIFKCFMKGISFNSTKGYEKLTIFVDLKDISIIDYGIDVDKKKELCKIGLKSVFEYFGKKL